MRAAILLLVAMLAATSAEPQGTETALQTPGDVPRWPREGPPLGIVAALSQTDVSITSTFAGSEILVFGAVKNPPLQHDFGVIVTIAGPRRIVTVRRKDRVAGIWANADAAVVAAPTFHAVATSGPLTEVLAPEQDRALSITAPHAVDAAMVAQEFRGALIRIRRAEGAYALLEGGVTVDEGTLFRTEIALPPDLTEGDYLARIFLTADGRVVADHVETLAVRKVGLERLLYTSATERPALYGGASLLIAVLAGWGAQAAFAAMRR